MADPQTNGFAWRVRLGDILTMCIVVMAAISLMVQIEIAYGQMLQEFGKLQERVAKTEAQLDFLIHK